jgi:site-specific recombinase XerD
MRVQRIQQSSRQDLSFELLDDDDQPIPAVSGFMRHLRARGCSPNTLSAYAFDLLHFMRFLQEHQLTVQEFTPARALTFLEYLSTLPSRKRAHRLSLVLSTKTPEGSSATRLSPATLNRIFAAVSSFYEYLILSDQFTAQENPIQKVDDPALARVSERHRPFLGKITRVVLYHSAIIATPPRRNPSAPFQHPVLPEGLETVIERYLTIRRVDRRPKTVHGYVLILHSCANWLVRSYPEIVSWAQVSREHLLAFAEDLNTRISAETGRPLSARTKEGYLVTLATFLRDVALWQWEDVPQRPLLGPGDLPKRAQRVPRYIPEEELTRLMGAIRTLDCPYQRTALLIARWSGARRDEIRRLEMNCLDSYSDGTPRLRIPAGKTYQERLVPLHEEAAQAIRSLQAHRANEPTRGFRDDLTGVRSHRLFVHHGKMFSAEYLFVSPLRQACATAGLVTPDGKATVTAHRFRHTVGTQLAEKGACLHTIMKVLGHTSASMSMVYAQISDQEVRKDYQAVLGPGAMIAGPAARALQAGELQAAALAWLKTNFLKTELGRCLRLPQEGPCECDLYLTCAKFVTTPEYAPRLRHRRNIEQDLIKDASARGWQREVERHQCIVNRLEQLLVDLAEPLDGPETTG